jgi:hypothetical protein
LLANNFSCTVFDFSLKHSGLHSNYTEIDDVAEIIYSLFPLFYPGLMKVNTHNSFINVTRNCNILSDCVNNSRRNVSWLHTHCFVTIYKPAHLNAPWAKITSVAYHLFIPSPLYNPELQPEPKSFLKSFFRQHALHSGGPLTEAMPPHLSVMID